MPDTAYPTGNPIQGTELWISTAASRHGPECDRAPATPRDPVRQRQGGSSVAGSRALLQRRHQLQAGIAVEFLGHRQIGEQGLLFRAVTCLHCPRFGGFYEVTVSATRPQQESIDAMRCGLGVLE